MSDSYDWKKVLLRVTSVKQGQKMLERILSHTVRVVVLQDIQQHLAE